MIDKENFEEELTSFFNSEDLVVLITGLDNDEKIIRILEKINDRYTRGTFYVNSISDVGNPFK